MVTLRQVFSDIAEAIRANGVKGTFKPIEMAQKIQDIANGVNYGYLTFTAEEATTLTLKQNGSIAPHKLLKSTDGVNWVKWENPSTNGISLSVGQSVYLKADEDALWRTAASNYDYNKLWSSGRIACIGDARSIVKLVAPAYYFNMYSGLFYGCSSLTTAPELPATILDTYCYSYMFNGCTSQASAPELPATTLADYCYMDMFNGCTSLTNAPDLPATTLAFGCYEGMFQGCTSLTQAPVLPATILAAGCYYSMFNGCTSLKRIKMNASSGRWGESMFSGCTSLELVDMTGSTGVPTLSNVKNFANTNNTYKIVVPDSIYDKWIAATNWVSIASHIMKQSDWNAAHPDDILG